MKRFDNVTLAPNQYQALGELRHRLFDEFDIEAVILYGSVARGEADEESDLDLLIVTARPLMRPARHEITDMVFICFQHGSGGNIGTCHRHGL